MANRDISAFRTVINQVASNPSGSPLLQAGMQFTENILREGEEAKINEGLSEVQLKLNEMQNQYQIDNQSNPLGGMEDYKAKRDDLFSEYGDQISPLYGRQWKDTTRNIATRNDAVLQGWALGQTKKNTVNSINKSMKNNFMQAGFDGQKFGQSDETEIESFINFAAAKEQLMDFGDKNLGAETTASMLETYDEDYMKSFLSGVADTNPHKALDLIKTEDVKDSFGDFQQYERMKKGIELKAKRFDAAMETKKKTNTLLAENSLGAEIQQMGYAEQQQYYEEHNVSPVVQAYYEEMSGYASSRKAVKGQAKVDLKRKFNLILSDIVQKDDVSDADLRILQDAVYGGMSKKVFSESEGFGYVNQLMTPILEKKQERISEFQTGEWNYFQENLGLDTLNEEIEKINGKATTPARSIGNDDTNSFMVISNQMYDFYLGSLEQEANVRGTTIAGLSELPFVEEKKVYNKALKAAKEGVLRSIYPQLSGVEKMPDKIIDEGREISTGLGEGTSGTVGSNITEENIKNMTTEELKAFLNGN